MDYTEIKLTTEEIEKIKAKSPDKLPLNPTAQGWSGAAIRRQLASGTFDNADSVLAIVKAKFDLVKSFFDSLDSTVALKANQLQLDSLFDDLVAGTITVLKAERDNEGNIIKSNYGSSITFDYEASTRVLTLKLFAKDGSQLGSDLTITLPNATQSASGLMSSYDKTNLDTLLGLLGVIGGDADSTVNKIREVLDIFNNYPETDNLLDVLATKATKEELAVAGFPNGWTRELLTSTALTNGQTISKETLEEYDIITLIAINTNNSEIDTDTIDTAVGLVDAYKYIFFDNASVFLTIGSTCTFSATSGYQLKIIGQKYEAQDAENVEFDKTVKNLLDAGNVQEAIDELADEVLTPSFVEVEHLALQSEITATDAIEIKDDSGELVKITGNGLPSADVDVLKAMGIKNDSGILFSALTPEEITEQLDIWAEQGYPTHINKLISKSDNLFNGKFNKLTSLASENLMPNADLMIVNPTDATKPLGYAYSPTLTNVSLVNGVWTGTGATENQSLYHTTPNTCNLGDILYCYANVKSNTNRTRLVIGTPHSLMYHTGSNEWEFLSFVTAPKTNTVGSCVVDIGLATSDSTTFSIDKIGSINITDLVSRGILPSGLTNAQYKDILDNALYTNVPLRESDYISVEPSVAYRIIKASENSATHKVIEYTTDNQIVKVNSVDYSGNVKISSPITMNALTRKIKLVSDLMERPSVEITNRFFTSTSNWITWRGTGSVANSIYTFVGNATEIYCSVLQDNPTTIGNLYYISGEFMTPDVDISEIRLAFDSNYAYKQTSPIANTWYKKSYLHTATGTIGRLQFMLYHATSISGKTLNARNPLRYNITDFINKGVVDDNGTLFSRLTNSEIKAQMDLWVQNGFPDHVINALYPSGADTAIAFKYNDGDAIYYPQVIDELPLDITLRADEYWQDGYIIKQNGNAEASPLGKVFSAWNYGQLEAVYDSGFPADFKVKYAQNTSAQVSTHSEYLKEARERIDTLRGNQEQLIEKLGLDIENDYSSFVGITGSKFEYYALEGVKSGNYLKIEALGTSVKNLLVNTIDSSITGIGLTITYDNTDGTFTVNGTTTGAGNIILKTGMSFGLPLGTTCQLMRYFVSGTINLNGSYVGYIISGTSVSNRINENSESLYDPYINGVGELKANGANPNVAGSSGQTLAFQCFKAGMVFTNFKFKIALYEGTKLLPFAMPETENNTDVDVYNRTANLLDMGTSDITYAVTSGITVGYNALAQEFVISGTASASASIVLKASAFAVSSGDRLSIKRLFQSGDITAVSTLPTLNLYNGSSVVLANSIFKMTAPEGETPTPDVSFNTGTMASDGTLSLRLTFASGDVFSNYRFRLMIHDKSTDIGYVAYSSTHVGHLTALANEIDSLEFTAIDFGVLEFVPRNDKLNVVFGDTINDIDNTVLGYNAGVQTNNRKLSVVESRITALDNPFRDKVIAIWGDSRESNNPTSDPTGVGDQKDTSYPALLAKKLGATVLNFGLSGGAWAENTVQQDAQSAIVNRVLTEDTSASADVIIISSMNDFKLATPLGSSATSNKTATNFYGAMRLTYDRLATKYPGKKIWLVLPQKRYDESTNYGGGDYLSYRKAQIDVAREYGIPTIDLYNNFPNTKPTFYATNMLNDTHFSAVGNDLVAEIIMRSLLGNGNSGVVDKLPALPTTNGTYTLKLTVLDGVNTFSWGSWVSDYIEVDITDYLVSTEDYTMTSNNLKVWKQGRVYGVCGIISLSLAGGKSIANGTALITAIPEAYRPNQDTLEHTAIIYNGLRSFQLKTDGVITVYPTAISGGAGTILLHIDFVYNK